MDTDPKTFKRIIHQLSQPPVSPPIPETPSGSSWARLGRVLAPLRWDWPGWLPRGFLTILASEPGAGKSMLCLRLAAGYLDAFPWPDGTPFDAPTGKVLWCETEASQALNLERARHWGLDLSRLLSPLPNPLHNFHLDLPEHSLALFHLARSEPVRLVVLDSLRGLRSRQQGAPSLAQLLADLAEIARVAAKPVLVTHHLRKRTNRDLDGHPALERLLGASAITQSARVVWALDTPNPAAPHHRRLSVIKNNLGPYPEPLGMKVDDDGVHFGPPPRPPLRYSELDRAVDFLRELLADGSLSYHQISRQAEAAGVTLGTLRRAKAQLGARSFRPSGQADWHWALPVESG